MAKECGKSDSVGTKGDEYSINSNKKKHRLDCELYMAMLKAEDAETWGRYIKSTIQFQKANNNFATAVQGTSGIGAGGSSPDSNGLVEQYLILKQKVLLDNIDKRSEDCSCNVDKSYSNIQPGNKMDIARSIVDYMMEYSNSFDLTDDDMWEHLAFLTVSNCFRPDELKAFFRDSFFGNYKEYNLVENDIVNIINVNFDPFNAKLIAEGLYDGIVGFSDRFDVEDKECWERLFFAKNCIFNPKLPFLVNVSILKQQICLIKKFVDADQAESFFSEKLVNYAEAVSYDIAEDDVEERGDEEEKMNDLDDNVLENESLSNTPVYYTSPQSSPYITKEANKLSLGLSRRGVQRNRLHPVKQKTLEFENEKPGSYKVNSTKRRRGEENSGPNLVEEIKPFTYPDRIDLSEDDESNNDDNDDGNNKKIEMPGRETNSQLSDQVCQETQDTSPISGNEKIRNMADDVQFVSVDTQTRIPVAEEEEGNGNTEIQSFVPEDVREAGSPEAQTDILGTCGAETKSCLSEDETESNTGLNIKQRNKMQYKLEQFHLYKDFDDACLTFQASSLMKLGQSICNPKTEQDCLPGIFIRIWMALRQVEKKVLLKYDKPAITGMGGTKEDKMGDLLLNELKLRHSENDEIQSAGISIAGLIWMVTQLSTAMHERKNQICFGQQQQHQLPLVLTFEKSKDEIILHAKKIEGLCHGEVAGEKMEVVFVAKTFVRIANAIFSLCKNEEELEPNFAFMISLLDDTCNANKCIGKAAYSLVLIANRLLAEHGWMSQ